MSEQQSDQPVRWIEGPDGLPLITNKTDDELSGELKARRILMKVEGYDAAGDFFSIARWSER